MDEFGTMVWSAVTFMMMKAPRVFHTMRGFLGGVNLCDFMLPPSHARCVRAVEKFAEHVRGPNFVFFVELFFMKYLEAKGADYVAKIYLIEAAVSKKVQCVHWALLEMERQEHLPVAKIDRPLKLPVLD
jgi:hypothetical protein